MTSYYEWLDANTGAQPKRDCKCNKWISIDNRLPEERGEYIVHKMTNIGLEFVTTEYYLGHGNWKEIIDSSVITHWMLLPEPPKST